MNPLNGADSLRSNDTYHDFSALNTWSSTLDAFFGAASEVDEAVFCEVYLEACALTMTVESYL